MKLIIPKIIEELKLSEYAEEWGDHTMKVWVNPTKEVNDLYDKNIDETNLIIKKLSDLKTSKKTNGNEWFETTGKAIQQELLDALAVANKKAMEWYSIIWSQGEETTRVTLEEAEKLAETAAESDPMFFQWICARTIDMIVAHRVNRKN